MDKGRPSQVDYPAIVGALDDKTVYTGASIAQFAETKGFIPATWTREQKRQHFLLIRMNMNALARRRRFPKIGDGKLEQNGQSAVGWRGRLWKEACFAKRRIPYSSKPSNTGRSQSQGDPT